MKYRPEIDGLRALAVVPVILFHAGFELFSGGFVGVDVFFVISGYLITTILIDDIENKRFSFVNFYQRRAGRILPALVVVMLFSTPLAWMLLSDLALNKFGNGLMGVAAFLSNVVFWRQQGYFDESAELNPLLHTWSLAVEEQYYVLFPIFLILAWRFGKNRVFWMIVVMAVISLLLSEWGWRYRGTANFYLAPTRAWELLAGSIAAFIVQRRGVEKNNALSLIGLAAIIFSIFTYEESTPFPSVYALVPVLGVVLLVMHADKETVAAKLLSTKPFVAIGLLSYSAYLWHQPIFAFTRVFKNQLVLEIGISLILIIFTFVLAYISWRFIEAPFRYKSLKRHRSILLLSLVALMTMFGLGFASKEVSKGAEYKLARQLSENQFVYFENMNERKFLEGRLIHPLNNVNYIVVGSSRVMEITSSIVGEPIQSFTVSGASIEDDIAFGLEALDKLKYRNIYIAADPWIINEFDGQDRYQAVSDLYNHWLDIGVKNKPLQAFFRSDSSLVLHDQSTSLLARTREVLSLSEHLTPTDGSIEETAKKAYDGAHIYNESYVNSTFEVNSDLDYVRCVTLHMTRSRYKS